MRPRCIGWLSVHFEDCDADMVPSNDTWRCFGGNTHTHIKDPNTKQNTHPFQKASSNKGIAISNKVPCICSAQRKLNLPLYLT